MKKNAKIDRHLAEFREALNSVLQNAATKYYVKITKSTTLLVLPDSVECYELYLTLKVEGNPDNIALFIREYCRQKLESELSDKYIIKVHINSELPTSYADILELDSYSINDTKYF